MLQSVTIENFKSFERATLPLAPLTLLIGANASGKSNAIEAMQLLGWYAMEGSSADLLYAVRAQELALRGGFRDLGSPDQEITLGCQVKADEESSALPFDFKISFKLSEDGLKIASRSSVTPKENRKLIFTFLSILFLDPEPRRMRGYSFVQERQLKRDGSALSSVLRQLTEEEDRSAGVLDMIRSLPEQDISGISYLETPRGEVMVQLHETFGGQVVPREAALLSDGTLRVLAVAAALFSVREGSTVVIEEIDNGVHPSRAEHLLSQIQKVARERNLRVLLTTHNPALLDALPLDAVPDVVACYRDPEKGDSRLVRLQDLESYSELVAQGPLGHLLTQGIVDRYLKSPEKRDRSKKVERDLAWIDELRRQA